MSQLSAAPTLDIFFSDSAWFDILTVNGYPVLGIVWNLLLLAVPFLAVKTLFRLSVVPLSIAGILLRLPLAIIWLAFIPNAAYIITDARHLSHPCAENYYRICEASARYIPFFFAYSAVGWVSLVYLLNQMKNYVATLSRTAAGFFPWLSIPLISLGVLLGLLHRLNSWDIVLAPATVLEISLTYLTDTDRLLNWGAYTILFLALYWIGDHLFIKGRLKNKN